MLINVHSEIHCYFNTKFQGLLSKENKHRGWCNWIVNASAYKCYIIYVVNGPKQSTGFAKFQKNREIREVFLKGEKKYIESTCDAYHNLMAKY
jgi:hypothetical protein